MSPNKALALVIVLTALLFLPSRAEACSCVHGTPICETFWQTSAVFAGEVIAITDVMPANPPQSSGIPSRRRVRFRVDAAYRGDVAGEVDVYTGLGGGDCGFTFLRGQKYLVFASVFEGRLSTGACSPTQTLAAAGPTLAYVSQTFAPTAGGRIYGSVQSQSGTGDARKPAPGYRVSLKSPARTWTATSDQTGAYEFTGVPAGKYAIEVTIPDTLRVFGPSLVELGDTRGCSHADFVLAPKSSRAPAPPLLVVVR